jgi:RNB domain
MELLYSHLVDSSQATITTIDAAKWLFDQKEVTPAEEFAAFNTLMQSGHSFVPVLPRNGSFIARSLTDKRNLQTVATHPETVAFLAKAKELIIASREGKRISVEFTDHDRVIIHIIKQALVYPSSYLSHEMSIALNVVIKRLSPLYSVKPNEQDIITFLKEIGVFLPNENTGINPKGRYGDLVGLQGKSSLGDELAKRSGKWAEELLSGNSSLVGGTEATSDASVENVEVLRKSDVSSIGTLADEDLIKMLEVAAPHVSNNISYRGDSCENIRRDLGDLPIYVIDSSSAHELDDGISIEKTAEGDWIHVHIADPTHLIAPSSPLAAVAQFHGNSVYIPERFYPMMPHVLSDKLFNLGTSKEAMTFSARLDSDGEICDYKITPSLINNVKTITYDIVDDVLGLDSGSVAGVLKGCKLNETDAGRLHSLHALALRHKRLRVKRGAFFPDQPSVSIKTTQLDHAQLSSLESFGHPNFETAVNISIMRNKPDHLSPAQTLVSEIMVLAGRITSKYCQDHKLSVGFRYQPSIASHLALFDSKVKSQAELNHELVLQSRDVHGVVPYETFLPLIPYIPPAAVSLYAREHSSMGIMAENAGLFTGYVKCTSPLRRFGDMMVHYQVKSALLNQPQIFDSTAVQKVVDTTTLNERRTRELQRRCEMFWKLEYMRRRELGSMKGAALSPSSISVPLDFTLQKREREIQYEGVVISVADDGSSLRVLVLETGIQALCIADPLQRSKLGDVVRCMVEKVNPDLIRVLMKQF